MNVGKVYGLFFGFLLFAKGKAAFFLVCFGGLAGGRLLRLGRNRAGNCLADIVRDKADSVENAVQNTGLDKVHKRNPDNRGDDEYGYACDAHAGVHGEQHLQRRKSGRAAENPRLKDAADDVENAVTLLFLAIFRR